MDNLKPLFELSANGFRFDNANIRGFSSVLKTIGDVDFGSVINCFLGNVKLFEDQNKPRGFVNQVGEIRNV